MWRATKDDTMITHRNMRLLDAGLLVLVRHRFVAEKNVMSNYVDTADR